MHFNLRGMQLLKLLNNTYDANNRHTHARCMRLAANEIAQHYWPRRRSLSVHWPTLMSPSSVHFTAGPLWAGPAGSQRPLSVPVCIAVSRHHRAARPLVLGQRVVGLFLDDPHSGVVGHTLLPAGQRTAVTLLLLYHRTSCYTEWESES